MFGHHIVAPFVGCSHIVLSRNMVVHFDQFIKQLFTQQFESDAVGCLNLVNSGEDRKYHLLLA
jgi:hypothetical protein